MRCVLNVGLEGLRIVFHLLLFLPHEVNQSFTSSYNGNVVRGTAGCSVNFTWAFSSSFTRVEWGLAATPYAFDTPPGLLVSFFKGNPLPVKPPAAYTGRVSGRQSGSQVIFTLRNISKLDGRLYGCLITDTTDPDDKSSFDHVTLEVEERPIIISPNSVELSYNESEAVKIRCEAIAKPEPDVRWIHHGQVKSYGNKTAELTFKTITKSDAGVYTCRANNSAGTAEKKLRLAIKFALTFMLPLEFDSNLRRYSFAFCESELLANNSSLATFATNIRFAMYIKCWFGSFTDFILLVLMFLPFVVGKIQLILPYQGRTVRSLINSSVNFTWRFSGDVASIEFGFKTTNAAAIETNGKILVLKALGKTGYVHQSYAGRVSGSRTGNSSSGQVIFSLSGITLNDTATYGCQLYANNVRDSDQFDYAKLIVEEPPRITHPMAANISYNQGSPVNVSCIATGTPESDGAWINILNTQVMSSRIKKTYLTFSSISKADAGVYTCRANNSAGSVEKALEITVKSVAWLSSTGIASANY